MIAARIQLLNGMANEQSVIVVNHNTHRAWNINDMDQFPQAEKSLAVDEVLIVDKKDGSVWRVAIKDAMAAGLKPDVTEVIEGESCRTSAI